MSTSKENQQAKFRGIIFQFLGAFNKENFNEVPLTETIKQQYDELKIYPPDRVKADNILQLVLLNNEDKVRYDIKILTNIIKDEDRLTVGCSAWIHIVDRFSGKSVMTREFYKKYSGNEYDLKTFLRRLYAYAKLFKAIVINHNGDYVLERIDDVDHKWQKIRDKEFYVINVKSYFKTLTKEEKEEVLKKEYSRKYWFKKTQPMVDAGTMRRERTLRKKWEKATI